jgi:hypothetical protein
MTAPTETATPTGHLAAIDAFRDIVARLDLDGQPVHASVATATVFAQLAQAVEVRYRTAAHHALAALSRGETARAVAVLQAVAEGRP